jgi:hypothetical protein
MLADQNDKMRKELTPMDWKLFFFPWYLDPNYIERGEVIVTDEMHKYFDKLAMKYDIHLTREQKNFYVKKREMLREKVFEEFPSFLDECFQAVIEGSYYATEMDKVFQQNRIMKVPFDPQYRVDTWWDLGMDDMNVILLTQSVGPQIRFIDMYYNRGESLAHYVKWLEDRAKEKGYRYGTNWLPHDVAVKELGTGTSRQEVLWTLGMRNLRVGKKIGINEGIDRDQPRHDSSSHFADAVRLLGCEWREYIPEIEGAPQPQSVGFFG